MARPSDESFWHKNTTAASWNTATPELLRPPKAIIDLSLPPEERWLHLIPDFGHIIKTALPEILDEFTAAGWIPAGILRFAARNYLQRMYDGEEHRELQGISEAVGVDMYILVAFNTVLDLLMGCTSGGIRTRKSKNTKQTKMLHFRTLDWGMDQLRQLVIEIDFVDNAADGNVLYTSITYVGYVGVLTGLKTGLSLSLNFRPNHDEGTIRKRLAFRYHQILVLLGKRRGIASQLRALLLKPVTDPLTIARELQKQHCTAAYITLCDGQTTVILDNDNCEGMIRQDSNLIVAVNHDIRHDQETFETLDERSQEKNHIPHMDAIILSSTQRQECVEALYKAKKSRVTEANLFKFMETCNEVSNDETHFGVVMDPTEGKIIWLQRYLKPLQWHVQKRRRLSDGLE